MDNILLTALLLVNCLLLVISTIAFLKIQSKYRIVESKISGFLTSPDANTPSPLAQTVDAMSQLLARAVIVQAKTSLMGMNSVEAKAEKRQATSEAMARFPALGFLQNLSPGLSKSLLKNPALLNLAGQFLQSKVTGQTGTNQPGNGKVSQPKFDL